MRRALPALIALGVVSLACAGPAYAVSKNVEHLDTLAEAKNATAINFVEYERRGRDLDVMLVTGRFGLKSYSLEDPEDPRLLDELGAEALRLRGDPPQAQARAAVARSARVRRLDDARAR
jgi:hypothetical protein